MKKIYSWDDLLFVNVLLNLMLRENLWIGWFFYSRYILTPLLTYWFFLCPGEGHWTLQCPSSPSSLVSWLFSSCSTWTLLWPPPQTPVRDRLVPLWPSPVVVSLWRCHHHLVAENGSKHFIYMWRFWWPKCGRVTLEYSQCLSPGTCCIILIKCKKKF